MSARERHAMTARPWQDDPLFWTQVMDTLHERNELRRKERQYRAFIRSCGINPDDALQEEA